MINEMTIEFNSGEDRDNQLNIIYREFFLNDKLVVDTDEIKHDNGVKLTIHYQDMNTF